VNPSQGENPKDQGQETGGIKSTEEAEPLRFDSPSAAAGEENPSQGENPKDQGQEAGGMNNAGEAKPHAPNVGGGDVNGPADKPSPNAPQLSTFDDAGENPQDRPIAANFSGLLNEALLSNVKTPSAPVAPTQAYALSSGDKFGEGLLRAIDIVRSDEASEARLVVEPPALGRIDISLKSSSDGVEAMFRVDNEELRRMVQNQLDSLKASLQAQGIHVYALTVDIRNNDGEKGRNDTSSRKKGQGRVSKEEDELAPDARIIRLDLEQGLLHWVA
jgi:hypothetical protein